MVGYVFLRFRMNPERADRAGWWGYTSVKSRLVSVCAF
jgi:hypothetical protein